MGSEVVSRDYVEIELKANNLPGMGIAISQNGKILQKEGFGFKNLETREPIDENTKWGIASCSKAFTATLIAMLVDEGKIAFDQPIREYLPDFEMYDRYATENCTIRDVLLHRVGLSEHDAVWADMTIDRKTLYQRLKYLEPRYPFRSQMNYNNTMYTIAGHIAEKISGFSWEEMVRTMIFEPLEMTESDTTLSSLRNDINAAIPYWPWRGGVKRMDIGSVSPGEPCAGIVTNLGDALKWLDFNLENGNVGGKPLVSKEQMEELHKAKIIDSFWPWAWPGLPKMTGYGLGWFVNDYRGYNIIFHFGEIEGYCTLMAFVPEKKITFVSYTNLHKPCIFPLSSILFTALDKLLKLEPIDWHQKFTSKLGQFGDVYQDWEYNLVEDSKPAAEDDFNDRSNYTGHYWNDGYGEIDIILKRNSVYVKYRGIEQKMIFLDKDKYMVPDIKEDTLLITSTLKFDKTSEKSLASGFVIDLDPLGNPIKFERRN